MDPPYTGVPKSGESINNSNQIEIPPGFGVEVQNQLVNQLAPIFDHLGNMIQNVNALLMLFTSHVPQGT